MKLVAVFFVLGTAAVLNIPENPTTSGMLFLLIATLASIFLLQTVIPGGLLSNNAVCWALVAFLLGIGNGWYVAKTELSHKLDASLHGIDVELIVQIDSVPVQSDEWSRFRCRVVKTVDVPPGFTPKRLQVTWYDPDELVAAGDTWRFRLRVKPPRGLMNPGGFDYAGWLFEQRVHALAYVREAPLNQRLATDQSLVSALRQEVRDNLLANSQGLHHTGLMQALVVGLRTDVPDAVWSLLRRTGTSHLLAISGLHIGLAATWGFLLGTALVRVLSSFGLQLNRLDVGGLVAFTVASGYSVLAGLTVPTRRALVMLLLYMLLVFTRRHGLKSTPFFIAMLVLVALDPLTILSPGFWLSFGAVGSLLYLTLGRVSAVGSRSARILQVLKVHTALAALLFPLTALFFGQASIISPLANLIAVPIASLVIVPLLLLWLLVGLFSDALAFVVLWLVDQSLGLLLAILQPLADLPVAALALREVHSVWLLAALLGVLVLMLPRCRERWLGFPLLLPLIWIQATPVFSEDLMVDVLDVGQGLSVVVRFQDKTLLYDTGGRLTPTLTAAEAVVTPFLESVGVQQLDHVVISHTDTDHGAGFGHIKKRWPVANWRLPADYATTPAQVCQAGESWRWGEVRMRVIYPMPTQADLAGSGNNLSCVLQIRYGKTHILLPGDLEKKAERRLLRSLLLRDQRDLLALQHVALPWSEILRRRQREERWPLSLLLAGHHGSKTSSASSWLDYFRPERVVYAVGYRNQFGFPHETVQMRYKVRDTIAYRTDHDGAVRFRFGPEGLLADVERYRLSAKRLWHALSLPRP